MRLLLLLLVALAPTAHLQAQYDSDAPEPVARVRGSVVLAGRGRTPSEVRDSFLDRAGRRRASVMVVTPEPESAEGFSKEDLLGVWGSHPGLLSVARYPDLTGLEHVDAVWVEASSAASLAALRDTPWAQALRRFLARGGVVGARGTAADAFGARYETEDGVLADGLGLLAGSFFTTALESDEDRERLITLLDGEPWLVGLGVEPRTALVLRERFLSSVGRGAVLACIAEAGGRSLRVERLRGRERADLLALSRSAIARTLRLFPPGDPAPPNVAKGTLMLGGGGRLPRETLPRFIELAGGPDALIVYVPCSYAWEFDEEPGFLRTLRAAGANNVTWIHTKDRDKANRDEQFLLSLRKARGIWFGGGRQWNFVDSYQNTTAHLLMQKVLERGGVIGGSSAGASIQADYMARGNPLGNADIMAEGYEEGLGFLTGVAIDQHFTQRGRHTDMESLVATYPQFLGIGLDEGTVLVVRGSIGEVLAEDDDRHVYFFDRRKDRTAREPIGLKRGQSFDLATGRVVD